MVSLAVSPGAVDSLHDKIVEGPGLEGQSRVPYAPYFAKTLELYEIGNRIMLSQAPAGSAFGDRLGLPRLYRNDEYFGTVVQLEACLNKWESTLPQSLRPATYQGNTNAILYRQAVILRLR